MKSFHCSQCNNLVFFENVFCERCGYTLGYVDESQSLQAFKPVGGGLWRGARDEGEHLFRQCDNYASQNICNWMIPAEDTRHTLCASCRLTHTIPPPGDQNRLYWFRIEQAKRRLLYTLAMLRLPVVGKQDAPLEGLAFEFLQDTPRDHVITGHDTGTITLNIAEADDVHREAARMKLNEPYRTLLGHLRHEVGHYYFDRLVAATRWIGQFRELFGDERTDYAQSMAHHYDAGPPKDWQLSYVSAYATMHPWEDWAETWAHYLHMFDALETADALGLALSPARPDEPAMQAEEPDPGRISFDHMMARWVPLTYALNSLNRSLGMPDGYPFALTEPVIEKLRFVHRVILAPKLAHPLMAAV